MCWPLSPEQPGWYRCPNVLGQVPSEPISKQEMVSLLGGVSYVVVGYHSNTDYCNTTDPNFEYAKCMFHKIKWADITLDDVRLDLYAPTGKLNFATPKARAGDRVLAYASVKNLDGSPALGASGIHLKVAGQAGTFPLSDGAGDDFRAGDGIYTGVFTVPVGSPHVTLYNGDDFKLDEADLPLIDWPALAVVTDWPRLYRDFLASGATPGEDLDANGSDDIYDLIARVRDYASAHAGVVYDLDKNITTDLGYEFDWRSMPDTSVSCTTPTIPPPPCPSYAEMEDELFAFLGRLHRSTNHSVENLVFLGDRDVLPMWDTMGDLLGEKDWMVTDVPYATSAAIRPENQPQPRPSVAFGRIFARRPYELVGTIDAFEKPLNFLPRAGSAAFFCLPSNYTPPEYDPEQVNDGIDWTTICRRIEPFLAGHYSTASGEQAPPYLPGGYYPYLQDFTPWRAISLTQALVGADLVLAFTHGSPELNRTPDVDLTVDFYKALPTLSTPIFVNAGCHTGLLQYGHTEADWRKNIVPEIVYHRVGYLAPTTISMGVEYALGLDDYMFAHFIEELWQPANTTVGNAWLRMWAGYYAAPRAVWTDPGLAALEATKYAYSKSYFGLPTQPIRHGAPAQAQVAQAQAAPAVPPQAQATGAVAGLAATAMTVEVDVPAFVVDSDGQGAHLVRPANGGELYGEVGMPIMPQVLYSFDLPAGVTAVTVTEISASRVSEVYGPLTLRTAKSVVHCASAAGCEPAARTAPAQAITQPYPSRSFGYDVSVYPEATRLTLNVIPAQYSPQGVLTLFKHLAYRVEYAAPITELTLSAVRLNNAQPVRSGQTGVALAATLTSDTARSLLLAYKVQSPAGLVIAGGSALATVVAGTQQVNLALDATDWPAGPHWLNVTVSPAADGPALATANLPFTVLGLRLELVASARHASAGAPLGLTVRAWDETGAPVSGLAGSRASRLTLRDDGTLLQLTWSESRTGVYTAALPAHTLAPGLHTLLASASDSRGITAQATEQIRIDPYRSYLPLSRRGQ